MALVQRAASVYRIASISHACPYHTPIVYEHKAKQTGEASKEPLRVRQGSRYSRWMAFHLWLQPQQDVVLLVWGDRVQMSLHTPNQLAKLINPR
jgi:hypothetical protein